jgi:beta-ribofuranosylaminobenzene 5'-phosphate synthase
VIQVRTGTRLHFGPLASGATAGRCFGGIGMMAAQPAISFRVVESREERCVGCSPATSERLRALRAAWESTAASSGGQHPASIPPLSWEFDAAPVEHAGFGTGTQLSLAVASVFARFEGVPSPSVTELAQRCGRGQRSAIGLHGFAQGGFLVDAGQTGKGTLGDLAIRLPVPEAWRIVILRPRSASPGLSGPKERTAFETLPPMSSQLTDFLCRMTLMEILPAVNSGNCAAFNATVSEYGRRIGEYFSPVQGGVFADPQVREIIQSHPALGQRLVQSSWGPSVVTFAPSESAAVDFCRQWESVLTPSQWLIDVSPPLNRGATISESD